MLEYKQFTLKNPKRIVIDLKKINVDSVIKGINTQICRKKSYIKSIYVGQFNPKTVRIIFKLQRNIKLQLFSLAPIKGFKERLIIDFYPSNVTIEDPLQILLKEHKKGNFQFQLDFKKSNLCANKTKMKKPFIIMLDPGHGGEDSGAVGKYHTLEKDIMLQIARRLKILIEKESNMRAYMTRNQDIFIPLKIRIAKAKKQCADLFVSIHADSFTTRKPNGSSVFAFSTKGASSTIAKYLSDTQNASDLVSGISKSGDSYLDSTIFDMVQSLTIKDSLKFGEIVLSTLGKINKLHKKTVEKAGFAVLKAPDIPSILVETAFISNVYEEKKLKTAKFQQKIANSIMEGIKIYFSRYRALV